MNLSPLWSHKKHYNFADTPPDICPCNQGIEHTRHFLFECLTVATNRARLAVTVSDVLHGNNLIDLANKEELYLYGHPSIISVNNKRILSATIQYIKNTQRFCSGYISAFPSPCLPPPLSLLRATFFYSVLLLLIHISFYNFPQMVVIYFILSYH